MDAYMSSNPKTLYIYIYILEFFREIEQDLDESELTKKEPLSYNSKKSKFKPRNREISIFLKPRNQEEK